MNPVKDHRWQIDQHGAGAGQTGNSVNSPASSASDRPAAHSASAIPCTACPPSLVLACVAHGLIRLSLPAAAVANGRQGASKQIRFTIDRQIDNRRAITEHTQRGFIPVIDLPVDDPLLDSLATGHLLELSFYGQRSYVGLDGAAVPITTLRNRCLPATAGSASGLATKRHCIWNVVIACSPDRPTARDVAANIEGAFVRPINNSHCAVLATDDLALAKTRAGQLGATLERSCVP